MSSFVNNIRREIALLRNYMPIDKTTFVDSVMKNLHPTDKDRGEPTKTFFDKECTQLRRIVYGKNGFYHRFHGLPALVEFFENGKLHCVIFAVDGMLHRDGNLPAYVMFYEDGSLCEIGYFVNGEFCRDQDDPVFVSFYEDARRPEYVEVYHDRKISVRVYFQKCGCVDRIVCTDDGKRNTINYVDINDQCPNLFC